MKLVDINIKKAKPRDKSYKLFDGHWLFIQIEPSGGKLWRYKYGFEGKEKLLALGRYPEVSMKSLVTASVQWRELSLPKDCISTPSGLNASCPIVPCEKPI